jgi:hypothetical protein
MIREKLIDSKPPVLGVWGPDNFTNGFRLLYLSISTFNKSVNPMERLARNSPSQPTATVLGSINQSVSGLGSDLNGVSGGEVVGLGRGAIAIFKHIQGEARRVAKTNYTDFTRSTDRKSGVLQTVGVSPDLVLSR